MDLFVAVEVRLKSGPQRSDSRRLKSGEAHSDRELAVGVRQGPLRSGAGSEAHCDRELAEVRRGPLRSRGGR